MKSTFFLIVLIFFQLCFTITKSQNKEFPYKLSKTNDIILLSTAVSSSLVYFYLDNNYPINYLTENEVLNLKRENINSIDRSATFLYSPKLEKTSDYIRDGIQILPILLAIPAIENKSWKNLFTLGTMYLEGFIINYSFTKNTKITIQRNRPYLYNTDLLEEERLELSKADNSYKSFFSGHSSNSFYNAVFISKVFTDIYGESTLSYVIWGITLSGAATTGYLRYKSGWHYPTDIFVGALVGSAIGYFIPVLHKQSKEKFTFTIKENNQFGFIYTF